MAHRVDVPAAVDDLVASMLAQPWGQVSTSIYETGRLVVFAPGLAGQAERLDHLVDTQGRDGSWGAPDGYALGPTLSATDALLCALERDREAVARTAAGRAALSHAADRGLLALFAGLAADQPTADQPQDQQPAPTCRPASSSRRRWSLRSTPGWTAYGALDAPGCAGRPGRARPGWPP